MDQYVEMKELAQQGLSMAEIGRRLGMERHTVAKYMESGPPRTQTRNRRSCLEPFRAHLEQRLSQGCTNGVVLLREIQAMGYEGGYTILKEFLAPRRHDERRRVELRWESAPPRWPRGKGKVESGVKYVRRNFWQGLVTISGVDDLNHRCRDWLDSVANVRTHGTTGRAPFEMLKDEDLAPVAGLPAYPVHLAVQRLVSRDCLVSYGGCRYSVPAEWAGKSVWVRLVRDDRVVVTAGGQVISEHPLSQC